MRAALLAAVLLPVLCVGAGNAAIWAGFRHEPGVETRALFTGRADWRPLEPLALGAELGFGTIDNPGLARAGLSARVRLLRRPDLGVSLGLAREQWPDWQAAEHRLTLQLDCSPLQSLTLGLGLARRAPLLGDGWQNPLDWSSPVAEWNLRYLLDWRFIANRRLSAGAYLGDLTDIFPPAPQQAPVGLHAAYELGRGWQLLGEAGAATKGLSGLLFSIGEVRCRIGVGRAL